MSAHGGVDRNISRGFLFAITLTSVTLLAEVIGGLWTNSLALLADAAHVFMDLLALVLSLAALKLARLPATDRRTYGWHRAEIFASLINGVTLLAMAVGILLEAWERVQAPEPVKSREMFIIATIGLVMNLVAARFLHGHSHDDLNVRSAFLHVLGDAIASVGVIAGGLIMLLTGWYVVDGLISVFIVLIIGWGAVRVIREASHILLEGVPPHIDIGEVVASMKEIAGVRDVHHVHCWSICSHITSLSAHVDIDPEQRPQQGRVIAEIAEMLERDYSISHSTLQGECSRCETVSLIQQLHHRSPRSAQGDHGHDHD